MLRWVISPIIGLGTQAEPYRPKVGIYGSYLSVSDGTWAFCLLRADDFTAAEADTDLIVMPFLPIDNTLTAGQANWLTTQLSAKGFPTAWIAPGNTVRWHLVRMARYIEPEFDTDWFRSI